MPDDFELRNDVPIPSQTDEDLARPLDGLYNRLGLYMTTTQIQDILRQLKDDNPEEARGQINQGNSKQEALAYLRRANSLGLIQAGRLEKSLQSLEEHGHKHVFMYQPKHGEEQILSDINQVSKLLFSADLGSLGFPRFTEPTNGYQWVDFRRDEDGGWTAKMYGHEIKRTSYGEPEHKIENSEGETVFVTVRRHVEKQIRTVLVAKWRPDGFLELRIDNRGKTAREGVSDRLNILKQEMRSLLQIVPMKGIPIDRVLTKLVGNRGLDGGVNYRVGTVELEDPDSGMVKLIPVDQLLDDQPGRSATLKTAMDEGMKPDMAEIRWCKGDRSPPSMPDELPTKIKKTEEGPRVSIRSQVSPEVANYVLGKIYGLCKY